MTKNQLNFIFDKVGLSTDVWLGHELKKVFPQILLAQDSNIYVSPFTYRYRFNNTKQVVELVKGNENSTGTEFISENGETSNYTPTGTISYSLIYSFVSKRI